MMERKKIKKQQGGKVNREKDGKGQRNGLIHYQTYQMNQKEKVICLLKGCVMLSCVSLLFYNSIWSLLCFLPYLYVYYRKECARLQKKRQEELRCQFKEGVQALQSALDTGYSVENAFMEACRDLQMIYPEGSYITMEFRRIVQGIRMNKQPEQMLYDFGERSGVEDIRNFAEVFVIAKKSGGDLLLIIRSTVNTIREKIEVQGEIETMMTGKRFEQKIMNVVPFGILGYVRFTSPSLLGSMYGNLLGIMIMTVCLAVYLVAIKVAEKIVSVEV